MDSTLMEWLIACEVLAHSVPMLETPLTASNIHMLKGDAQPHLHAIARIMLRKSDDEGIEALANSMEDLPLYPASQTVLQCVMNQFSRTYRTSPHRINQKPKSAIASIIKRRCCDVKHQQRPHFYSELAQQLLDELNDC